MPGIFISYRSADAQGFAGRLADDLSERFGDALVFRDDELIPGTAYPDAISEQLHACEALLAVIGPNWWRAATEQGDARLLDPDDWVRREIELALSRGAYVVPVLVAGANLPPAAALPEGLRALTDRQSFALSDDDWRDDVERLAKVLRERLPGLRDARSHAADRGVVDEALDRIAGRAPYRRGAPRSDGPWRAIFRACLKGLKSALVLMLFALFAYFLVSEYGDAETKEFFFRLQRFALKLVAQGMQQLQMLLAP